MIQPKQAFVFVIVAAAGALGVAFLAQYVGGLAPCPLCLYQRYPYGVAVALGLLGLLLTSRPKAQGPLLALAGLAFLATAGIAAFHVGVEQGWWRGTSSCGGAPDAAQDFEAFKDHILNAPLVTCGDIPWSLFGVSIAGYNFLYAAACAIAAMIVSRRLWSASR